MIEKLTVDFIRENSFISETSMAGLKIYDAPVICYADANDEIFEKFRSEYSATYGNFIPPEAWLKNAATVISIFFPYSEKVRKSNAKDMRFPSLEWRYGRVEGQEIINKCTQYVVDHLKKHGYDAVAPGLDERFKMSSGQDVEKPSEITNKNFFSNWSERHVAFAAGHGTFGLSQGLISHRGIAGRYSSIITSYKHKSTPRNYTEIYEYCTKCGQCAANCPVNAISIKNGKDHLKCSKFLTYTKKKDGARFGCGKCQVNVPCEHKIPSA